MKKFFIQRKKARKFNNRECVYDGIKFDSLKERDRYVFLKEKEREGLIKNLECHVRMEILPAIKKTVEVQLKTKTKTKEITIQKPIYYEADFVYEKDGEPVYEDVKPSKEGFKFTKVFALKKKMFFYKYGKEIKLVYVTTENI